MSGCPERQDVPGYPWRQDYRRVYTVRENQGKTYLFRNGQGKSGRVREFNEKVREELEKVREIFFGKFLSPMNQDPLFFKIQSIFFKIQL